MYLPTMKTLQWRHKCAWNYLRFNCLCNRLSRRRSKKTWKLRMDSPHKGPVTRKIIPFQDVIMNEMDSCRCETIFWPPIWPPILTPGSIYNTIFWPLHDILTLSQQCIKQFCLLWTTAKCGVLLYVHNIYECVGRAKRKHHRYSRNH